MNDKVVGASCSQMNDKVVGASCSLNVKREQDAPTTLDASATSDTWEYFNPFTEIKIQKGGDLPHWSQEKVWYFITYRLADSLPQKVIEEIQQQREAWLKTHDANNLSQKEIAEYYKLFSERYETLLNAGSGSCLLKDPVNAEIVVNAFRFFENQRYELDEFVVMPNHVHVLVRPLNGHRLEDILHSWKSFTANKINKRMGRTGQLWLHESYDHIVRNERAMNAIRLYIRNNSPKVVGASKVTGASCSLNEQREQDAPATIEAAT